MSINTLTSLHPGKQRRLEPDPAVPHLVRPDQGPLLVSEVDGHHVVGGEGVRVPLGVPGQGVQADEGEGDIFAVRRPGGVLGGDEDLIQRCLAAIFNFYRVSFRFHNHIF